MPEQKLLPDFKISEDRDRVRIYADIREVEEISEKLARMGAEVRKMALPAGDFILSERIVAERKTRDDFESSIIDGRLFTQAARLCESFERVLFVIEGERFEMRVRKEALMAAIATIIGDFGASVFFTKDAEKTAELLYAIAKREQLEERREVRLKGVKKAYTLAEQQQMVVESLPGVGPLIAKAMLRKFGSIQNIANASEKELMEVEKIGKKKAKIIRSVLSESYE